MDDDIPVCEHLSRFIESLGHVVETASDGDKAMDALAEGDFDVLISDVGLPGKSGLELAAAAREMDDPCDVVLISGNDQIIESLNAMDEGVYDFLIKPVHIKRLAGVLGRLAIRRSGPTAAMPLTPGEAIVAVGDLPEPRSLVEAGNALQEVGIYSHKVSGIYRKLRRLEEFDDIPVLIQGETGTGKEVLTRYLHFCNADVHGAFVALNCALFSSELFAAELFGYERGAFTGARPEGMEGKIALAKGGTLFLDKISELSLELQARLLRLLQDREYYRVGGISVEKVECRIVCASNRDLKDQASRRMFRDDLLYRLLTCAVYLPPLRERPEEIRPLAINFIKRCTARYGKVDARVETSSLDILESYPWPGNIRQFENAIKEWILFEEGDTLKAGNIRAILGIEAAECDEKSASSDTAFLNPFDFELPLEAFKLEDYERRIVEKAILHFNGNKSKVADFLGLSRAQLYGRFADLGKKGECGI